jgi:hypothetical protein
MKLNKPVPHWDLVQDRTACSELLTVTPQFYPILGKFIVVYCKMFGFYSDVKAKSVLG